MVSTTQKHGSKHSDHPRRQIDTISAGAVIVRRDGDRWRYLLLRAYQHWDFPKGKVEDGEKPFNAACREVCEETTLEDLRFRWGDRHIETGPYGPGKLARYYLAEASRGEVRLMANPELGRPEHDEFRWLAFDEAQRLVRPRVAKVLRWAREQLESEPDHSPAER